MSAAPQFQTHRELSDEAKDAIYDETNQIIHDTVWLWLQVDQGSTEEVEGVIQGIEGRLAEIRVLLKPFEISPN